MAGAVPVRAERAGIVGEQQQAAAATTGFLPVSACISSSRMRRSLHEIRGYLEFMRVHRLERVRSVGDRSSGIVANRPAVYIDPMILSYSATTSSCWFLYLSGEQKKAAFSSVQPYGRRQTVAGQKPSSYIVPSFARHADCPRRPSIEYRIRAAAVRQANSSWAYPG